MPEATVRARSPWFIKYLMNPIFSLTGAFPILSFRGRRSGKVFKTPMNVLELNGVRYLVSPRGETGWSRNLRVAADCSLKMRGEERRYRATEVPVQDRPSIIDAYLQRWGNQTRAEFEKLPNPADHPTFRLDPT